MSNPPVTKMSRVVVPHKMKWHQKFVAWLIHALMWGFAATWRVRWIDESGVLKSKDREGVIFCSWHNRLAISMMINSDYAQKHGPGRGLAAIVSASKDGGIVARILELFDCQPVRGSSSRRGAQALLELTTWAERGLDIAITPDGPRGPCYKVQDGITSLAQVTGLAIIPCSGRIYSKITIKSWDRFQIPLPFTRIDVRFGKPIIVPRDCSDEERGALRRELEERMKAMTQD
jgi:lysophospholipid acyltransferase (LPLAT)-like uncharacterized protein